MEDVYATKGKITTTIKFSTWKPLAPNYLLSALQAELATWTASIHHKTTYTHSDRSTKREPSFDSMSPLSKCTKRSLLHCLGDTHNWLTRTAATKDLRDIKRSQPVYQNTDPTTGNIGTCHLDIKHHQICMQVNIQHISALMEAVERTLNDVTKLFNITSSLYTHINHWQILLHIHSFLANFRDSLYYMRQDSHACNGLHRCNHQWCIITICPSSRRSIEKY